MGFEIINMIKKEKGLTNAQIAQMSGITLSTLDKITSGINTNPKLDTLQAICSVLGCTLNDFVDAPSTKKEALTYSSEAKKLAQDYNALDSYGKRVVRLVVDAEKVRCAEQAQSSKIIKIAGRDGSFTEKHLTDDQIKDLRAYIDQLPDPSDDL